MKIAILLLLSYHFLKGPPNLNQLSRNYVVAMQHQVKEQTFCYLEVVSITTPPLLAPLAQFRCISTGMLDRIGTLLSHDPFLPMKLGSTCIDGSFLHLPQTGNGGNEWSLGIMH